MAESGIQRDALAGIRIADFTWAASGPLATMYLALLGAEVIKIESAKSLDIARRGYYKLVEDVDASPNFNDMMLNKLSLRLNLAHPNAQALARRLVEQSDATVENFRPGIMAKFGLSYEDLRPLRPDIVMLSSSTAGQVGPERDLVGYATTFGAMGGLGHGTGYEDGPATEVWDSVDMRLGTSIALALLMALYHRRRTGQGQHIDFSSREVISANLGDVFMDYFMNGRVQGRQGNRDEIMAPHNCYPCLGDDQWISIAVANDDEWGALCRVAGHPEWTVDPRFLDRYARWQNQEALDGLLAEWTRGHAAEALTTQLQAAGIAAMPSMDVVQSRNDPHLQARGLFFEVEHPKLGLTHPLRPPWVLSETPARATRYGPHFGQHEEYVLGDILGVTRRELDELRADGALE